MQNRVALREEWLQVRRSLLSREKEATRLRDSINADRLALSRVEVEKDYVFDTAGGPRSLADLFAGRSQLIIYHFMLGPGWDAGCTGCSFLADHLDGTLSHLQNHDVTPTSVSRAPLWEINAYKARTGWRFPWVSSHNSDFNYDYQASFNASDLAEGHVRYNFTRITAAQAAEELPGLSSFFRDDSGRVYHTYSSYARGPEELIGTLMILDRAPKGRNEDSTLSFVRRHDEYTSNPIRESCCSATV